MSESKEDRRTPSVVVRLLTRDETALLVDADPEVFDNDVDPVQAEAFLIDDRHILAAALSGGKVVGFASAVHYLHPDKRPELWINELGVAERFRERGVGLQLVELLLDTGKAMGCEVAWVLTEAGNARARRLYARAGGSERLVSYVEFDL